MRVLIAVVLLASALTGCAIVPYGPGVYVQPSVVVSPGGYYGGGYYGHGGYDRRGHDYRR